MAATVIDGKALARKMRAEIAAEVASLRENHEFVPGLAAVLVGDDPASAKYVAMKERACAAAGMTSRHLQFDADVPQHTLEAAINELNAAEDVDGILVQLPLPGHIDPYVVASQVDEHKDVDALHPATVGRLVTEHPTFLPATPAGVLELIKDAGVETEGQHVVVIGRSGLVGRPLSILLSQAPYNATVTVAHSRTKNLAAVARTADILVSAVGRPGLVTADMIKPGACVIDVGTSKTDNGLAGDVDYDAVADVAGFITPVPGGVGPMTVTMLLHNTLRAAKERHGMIPFE